MLTTIGNLFLGIATLIFLALFNMMFLQRVPRSGDGLMGYAWGIIIGFFAFFVCMAIVAAAIGAKGGFAWVGATGSSRFLLVSAGVFLTVLGAGMAGITRGDAGGWGLIPLRILSTFTPALIPALLIVGSAILLNDGLLKSVPAPVYQWSLMGAAVLGLFAVSAGVFSFVIQEADNRARRIKSNIDFEDSNQQRMLNEIDTCDLSKNMVFILVFTDANQSPQVRERAVAKVKTRPDWQEELVRRLQNDWAPESFNFLASNEVDDKSLFPEAVRQGVLIQARLIRESIRASSHPSHFYPGRFSWEVERVLRTVDRFEGLGVDFLPAVKELRAALDERSEYEKPKFQAASVLDKWIKKHS